jgi:hypothetical protein
MKKRLGPKFARSHCHTPGTSTCRIPGSHIPVVLSFTTYLNRTILEPEVVQSWFASEAIKYEPMYVNAILLVSSRLTSSHALCTVEIDTMDPLYDRQRRCPNLTSKSGGNFSPISLHLHLTLSRESLS